VSTSEKSGPLEQFAEELAQATTALLAGFSEMAAGARRVMVVAARLHEYHAFPLAVLEPIRDFCVELGAGLARTESTIRVMAEEVRRFLDAARAEGN
jgi:hypothetical protein